MRQFEDVCEESTSKLYSMIEEWIKTFCPIAENAKNYQLVEHYAAKPIGSKQISKKFSLYLGKYPDGKLLDTKEFIIEISSKV